MDIDAFHAGLSRGASLRSRQEGAPPRRPRSARRPLRLGLARFLERTGHWLVAGGVRLRGPEEPVET